MDPHALDFVEHVDMNLIRKSHLLSFRQSPEGLESLMESIRQVGLLQPIIVRRTDDGFEIVAGHRRYESCRRLRWRKIPSCIVELSDKDAFEVALTENIQRKSLNPVQEAEAFSRYVEEYGWGGVTELARRIGKSQEYVSQRILLLSLPEDVREKMISRQLSPSAARELIWVKDGAEQARLAEFIVKNKVPTRAVRYMVRAVRGPGKHHHGDVGIREMEPDFVRYAKVKESNDSTSRTLEKTILALRICMLRIDSLLSGMESEGGPVRDFLMEERIAVHSLIDKAVKMKVEMRARLSGRNLLR